MSACIILANAKDGFIFRIGEDGSYIRSSTYWISLVGPAIILLLSSILIINRKLPLWDKVILLSYPVIPLISAVEGAFVAGPTMLAVYVFISMAFTIRDDVAVEVPPAKGEAGEARVGAGRRMA